VCASVPLSIDCANSMGVVKHAVVVIADWSSCRCLFPASSSCMGVSCLFFLPVALVSSILGCLLKRGYSAHADLRLCVLGHWAAQSMCLCVIYVMCAAPRACCWLYLAVDYSVG